REITELRITSAWSSGRRIRQPCGSPCVGPGSGTAGGGREGSSAVSVPGANSPGPLVRPRRSHAEPGGGWAAPLWDRQDDLAKLLAAIEVFMGLPRSFEREDAVHDWLEPAHEHELHDLLELPAVRHRRPEDRELPPVKVAGVELE